MKANLPNHFLSIMCFCKVIVLLYWSWNFEIKCKKTRCWKFILSRLMRERSSEYIKDTGCLGRLIGVVIQIIIFSSEFIVICCDWPSGKVAWDYLLGSLNLILVIWTFLWSKKHQVPFYIMSFHVCIYLVVF